MSAVQEASVQAAGTIEPAHCCLALSVLVSVSSHSDDRTSHTSPERGDVLQFPWQPGEQTHRCVQVRAARPVCRNITPMYLHRQTWSGPWLLWDNSFSPSVVPLQVSRFQTRFGGLERRGCVHTAIAATLALPSVLF